MKTVRIEFEVSYMNACYIKTLDTNYILLRFPDRGFFAGEESGREYGDNAFKMHNPRIEVIDHDKP